MKHFERIYQFLTTGLWRMSLDGRSTSHSLGIRILRVFVLSLREFKRDKCGLRASALTFYTLLSIVPVLAMAFGVAKGFDFDVRLKESLRDALIMTSETEKVPAKIEIEGEGKGLLLGDGGTTFTLLKAEGTTATLAQDEETTASLAVDKGQEAINGYNEVVENLIEMSTNQLEQAQGGVVAGIGVFLLFWLVIKILSNIERSFNDIWHIRKSRSLARKLSDYLAFMVISPILFVFANSLKQAQSIIANLKMPDLVSGILKQVVDLVTSIPAFLPWVMICGLFTFTYIFMPNRKVRFRSGLLAGLVAGTLYLLVQALYLKFQIGLGKYGAVYGSFAALPFFLVWLQVSWLVVLYGAEISFAEEHVDDFVYSANSSELSETTRKTIALGVLRHCVQAYKDGEQAPSAAQAAEALGIAQSLTQQMMDYLVSARVLSEVNLDEEDMYGYLPATDIDKLTVADALQKMDRVAEEDLNVEQVESLASVQKLLSAMYEESSKSKKNIAIRNL